MELKINVNVDQSPLSKLSKSLNDIDKDVKDISTSTNELSNSLSKSSKSARTALDGVKNKTKDVNASFKNAAQTLKGEMTDGLSSAANSGGMVAQSLSKVALAAGPVGVAILAVTAAVAGVGVALFKAGADTNKFMGNFKKAFGDADKSIIIVSKRIMRLGQVSQEELIKTAKIIRNEFGSSLKETTDLLDKAVRKGLNLKENQDQIQEYASKLKESGLTAREAMSLITDAANKGFLSDKAVDAVKEASISLREMPKATSDALKLIGINGDQLSEAITKGTIKPIDAIRLISGEMVKAGEKSKITGTLLADVFKSPGEDISFGFFENLVGGIKDLGEMNDNMTQSERLSEATATEWDVFMTSVGTNMGPIVQRMTDQFNTATRELIRGMRYALFYLPAEFKQNFIINVANPIRELIKDLLILFAQNPFLTDKSKVGLFKAAEHLDKLAKNTFNTATADFNKAVVEWVKGNEEVTKVLVEEKPVAHKESKSIADIAKDIKKTKFKPAETEAQKQDKAARKKALANSKLSKSNVGELGAGEAPKLGSEITGGVGGVKTININIAEQVGLKIANADMSNGANKEDVLKMMEDNILKIMTRAVLDASNI